MTKQEVLVIIIIINCFGLFITSIGCGISLASDINRKYKLGWIIWILFYIWLTIRAINELP